MTQNTLAKRQFTAQLADLLTMTLLEAFPNADGLSTVASAGQAWQLHVHMLGGDGTTDNVMEVLPSPERPSLMTLHHLAQAHLHQTGLPYTGVLSRTDDRVDSRRLVVTATLNHRRARPHLPWSELCEKVTQQVSCAEYFVLTLPELEAAMRAAVPGEPGH